jgi:hypothetical protein
MYTINTVTVQYNGSLKHFCSQREIFYPVINIYPFPSPSSPSLVTIFLLSNIVFGFLIQGLTVLPKLASNLDPPASDSQVLGL